MADLDPAAYHDATRHRLDAFAPGPEELAWASRPDPFRRYGGAPFLRLDEAGPDEGPLLGDLDRPGAVPPEPLDRGLVSRLLYDSLALSAWKEHGRERWPLRCHPASGNLHPLEAYLLAGPVAGLTETPALLHYAPREHGLERLAELPPWAWEGLCAGLPLERILVGLTSILWRTAWKYGERAFRYVHLDLGHALGGLSLAAAARGFELRLLEGQSHAELARLLGTDRQEGPEAEEPELLAALVPPGSRRRPWRPDPTAAAALGAITLAGNPTVSSSTHREWPLAAAAVRATRGPAAEAAWTPPPLPPPPPAPLISVRRIIRGRRSGTGYDGEGRLSRPACHRLLRRLLPDGSAPLAALPGAPGIHLLLFVHRVEDLAPGLYALIRNPEREGALRAAMSPRFAWAEPPGTPPWLPLRLLEEGDFRRRAALLSCGQEIAGDGALAAAMVADFAAALAARGPAGYRRLHWEAGVLGQLLYLEAEAAGMRGTGIGCFFDDSCHELAGLAGGAWRDLYHFTLGAAREDPRARTLPAYGPEP